MTTPGFARLARGEVMAKKQEIFVQAAWVLGASPARLLFRHVLPNVVSPILVKMSLDMGFAILTDPAAAKSRLPAGSYGWGGIYGTQFWIDPTNRVVGLVMTQTAIIGSGPISNPIREAFYTAD